MAKYAFEEIAVINKEFADISDNQSNFFFVSLIYTTSQKKLMT